MQSPRICLAERSLTLMQAVPSERLCLQVVLAI